MVNWKRNSNEGPKLNAWLKPTVSRDYYGD